MRCREPPPACPGAWLRVVLAFVVPPDLWRRRDAREVTSSLPAEREAIAGVVRGGTLRGQGEEGN